MPRGAEKMDDRFLFAEDIAEILSFSTRKAYDIIKELNAELAAKGKMTFTGRIPKNYFEARCDVIVVEEVRDGKVVKSVV